MYRIRWRKAALESLYAIGAYLGELNPYAAAKIVARIHETVTGYIAFMPLMFPAYETGKPSVRVCALQSPYLIFYEVLEEQQTVEILKIIHAAQGSLR